MPMSGERRKQIADGLKQTKERIAEAKIELSKAKRAGLDVTELEKQLRVLETSYKAVERVYGPVR